MPFSRPSDDDLSDLSGPTAPARTRSRGALTALSLIAAVTLSAAVLLPAASAEARFAEGGTGEYTGAIDWVDWSPSGATIRGGKSVTETRTIAGETLATTCSISNLTGDIAGYRPGHFAGDNLDDLYNIGGTGKANRLVAGLANVHLDSTVSFTFACKATLNGAAIPIGGLVVADAESSNRSQGEYVQAKPAQTDTTWRIIERARNCTTNVLATLSTDKTLRLAPDNEQCSMRVSNGQGPMVIGYMDGATSATVTIRGGGKSAVALGVMFDADFGDAPASYGAAGSLFERSWIGGEVPVGTTNVSSPSFTLGTPAQPKLRLGATVDADNGQQSSSDASADDAMNADDEDAIDMLAPQAAKAGEPHTISDIRCAGAGAVAGWLDWNRDGRFGDDERSDDATCAAGSVALTWSVPNDMQGGASFLRLRTAPAAADIFSPVDIATLGETEDHSVTIAVPQIEATKTSDPASGTTLVAGQEVRYTLTFANTGLAAGDVAWTDDMSDVLDDARMISAPASDSMTTAFARRTLDVTGTLAAGESATVTYTVRVAPVTQRANDALRNMLAPSALADPTCAASGVVCTEHPVVEPAPAPEPPVTPELPPVADEPTPDMPGEADPMPEVPAETAPDETIPEESIPEETMPDTTPPIVTDPVIVIPEETLPEETVPEETLPDATVPEETLPEETLPEETLPDVTVPQGPLPDITIPGGDSGTTLPGTDPEVVIPEEVAPVEDAPVAEIPAAEPQGDAPVETPAASVDETPLAGASTSAGTALATTGGTAAIGAALTAGVVAMLGALLLITSRRRAGA